ncbi:MAG: hypothetical protein ABF377_03770 [Akkermansiaceae bacterium]
MKIVATSFNLVPAILVSGSLLSCSHTGNDDAVPGAVIPLKNISPGIDNSDWSNTQSKAAWREYDQERNIEEHPFR